MLWQLMLIVLSAVARISCYVDPTETYPHMETLVPEKVILHWKRIKDSVTFEVHGKTAGWVGIGFSEDGSMTGADMAVGWVKDNKVYITDRHGESNAFPPLDEGQNVHIITGRECDGWTLFKFSRKLEKCEGSKDRPIEAGLQRVIWAYGTSDPSGEDMIASDYHQANRGTKNVTIFEPPESATIADETYSYFNLTVNNFSIPTDQTHFTCLLFKLPELESKHHIVQFAPLVEEGHDDLVRHLNIFLCYGDLESEFELGSTRDCTNAMQSKFSVTCTTMIAAWGVGQIAYPFPSITGFPIGGALNPIYVQLRIHYENPDGLSGVVDNSGMNVKYTANLRTYDTGVFQVGNTMNPLQHFIPPGADSYTSVGFCASDCFAKRMEVSGVQSIKVHGTALHSHRGGRILRLRHIRGGIELPYIGTNEVYDFGDQDGQGVSPRAEVRPGDVLQMECIYNTTERSEMTQAGLLANEEMCIGAMFYYPKIDLSACWSSAEQTEVWSYFGIERAVRVLSNGGLRDFRVTEPESLAGRTVLAVMSENNWTEESIDKFSDDYMNMTQEHLCAPNNRDQTTAEYLQAPVITEEYVPPIDTCVATATTSSKNIDNECSAALRGSGNLWVFSMVLLLLY